MSNVNLAFSQRKGIAICAESLGRRLATAVIRWENTHNVGHALFQRPGATIARRLCFFVFCSTMRVPARISCCLISRRVFSQARNDCGASCRPWLTLRCTSNTGWTSMGTQCWRKTRRTSSTRNGQAPGADGL